MKCRCGKELTTDMEIEYSAHLTEYFCSPECATDRYFDVMESVPVDFMEDLPLGVVIVDGKLVETERITL